MGALQALRRTPGALGRAPGLVVPQLIVFALLLPQLLLQSAYPLVATLVSLGSSAVLLVGMPFVQGGMIGMADEALTSRSSLSRFVADGKDNYLRLLLAYVLLLVVNSVLGAIGFVAGIGAFLAHGTAGLALVAVAALVGVVYLVVAFFVQFYSQAIVVDGASVTESFRRSYDVVRSNVLTTLGYVLVAAVVGAVTGAVYGGVSLLASPEAASTVGLPTLSLPLLVVVGLVAAVVGSVASAFALTFSVAVYDELTA